MIILERNWSFYFGGLCVLYVYRYRLFKYSLVSLVFQMISSLTFQQENTIADEPVVDLLKYVNNLLDDAVTRSRLPSGYNPLQQLVLIIADGRFNEKVQSLQSFKDGLYFAAGYFPTRLYFGYYLLNVLLFP